MVIHTIGFPHYREGESMQKAASIAIVYVVAEKGAYLCDHFAGGGIVTVEKISPVNGDADNLGEIYRGAGDLCFTKEGLSVLKRGTITPIDTGAIIALFMNRGSVTKCLRQLRSEPELALPLAHTWSAATAATLQAIGSHHSRFKLHDEDFQVYATVG